MTDRTHGPFRKGDVCILQNGTMFPELNGEECVVIGGLEMRRARERVDGEVIRNEAARYKVRLADGTILAPSPHKLRLRPPKSDQSQWIREATTTWEKCAWQPVRERV